MPHYAETIYDKVQRSEPLTAYELANGHKFYKDLVHKLSSMGPAFELTCAVARKVYAAIEAAKLEPVASRTKLHPVEKYTADMWKMP